jgi:SAM-dependent methyltransferase
MDALLLKQHLELEERHWWFVGRRRIVLGVLDRFVPAGGGPLDVLDAGCGGGATLESLRNRYGNACGLELSGEAVAYARERGRDVMQGSIEEMPFADESLDLALALDVIEHVYDDASALRELHRVLKPGGSLLLTVPALMLLWSQHDMANGHYRRYTEGQLRRRVEEAGFETAFSTYFNTLLFPPVLAARLLWRLRPKKVASDVAEVAEPVNAMLAGTFSLERHLLGHVRLPIGVSALCYARKPGGGGTSAGHRVASDRHVR